MIDGTRIAILATSLALLCSSRSIAVQVPDAIPVNAIEAIVGAFKHHDVVALSDAHGIMQVQDFLRALIADGRLAGVANDIVIEFGNARFQSVADRYVSGDSVSPRDLRAIWQNTTVANELPIDKEFFATVRQVNAKLPRDRQFRVLLGDPPIDWSTVKTRDEHFQWLAMRDSFPASLLQVEVLAKRRKALLIYGHLHFQRRNIMSNLDMTDWRAETIISLFERTNPKKAFVIWALDDELSELQPSVRSWPTPSVAVVAGTLLGIADIASITPPSPRMIFGPGRPTMLRRDEWKPLRIEEQLDAVLYLGPRSSMKEAPLLAEPCGDPGYLEERLRRIAVVGLPPIEAQRAKELCSDKRR